MDETKSKEFNQDEGWETLDEQQIYSEKDYEKFEKQRIAEIQNLIERGVIVSMIDVLNLSQSYLSRWTQQVQ